MEMLLMHKTAVHRDTKEVMNTTKEVTRCKMCKCTCKTTEKEMPREVQYERLQGPQESV